MTYRYNLTSFADRKEYCEFLTAVVNNEQRYLVNKYGFVSGSEIKGQDLNNSVIFLILTKNYIEQVCSMSSFFQDAAQVIDRVINKVFSGAPFSWRDDTLPVIEQMQQLVDRCGNFLPNPKNILAIFNNTLHDMQREDIYAFADQLIGLEQHLQYYMGCVNEDVQFIKESGVLTDE